MPRTSRYEFSFVYADAGKRTIRHHRAALFPNDHFYARLCMRDYAGQQQRDNNSATGTAMHCFCQRTIRGPLVLPKKGPTKTP